MSEQGASSGANDRQPDVAGVRVLVTGSTGGLGMAMAEALVAGGAKVAVSGRASGRVAEAVAQLHGVGLPAVGVVLDVRSETSVEEAVTLAVERLGGLDVLVNNAGIGMRTVNPRFFSEPSGFWTVSPDQFRAVIDTNLTGYFLVARQAVPYLSASGHGKIVNITMNHETMRRKGFVPYGPSRAGAEALSRVMAADLASVGVTVNMLLPGGATLTGMIPDEVDEATRAKLLPASVMGPPIRWLCSEEASGITDERIVASEFNRWLAERQNR